MRVIVYTLLAALVLLVLKAFYLDDYLAKRKAGEANVSVETAQTAPSSSRAVEPEPKPVVRKSSPVREGNDTGAGKSSPLGEGNDTVDMRMMPNYKEGKLEKLGDSIAEKIGDKL